MKKWTYSQFDETIYGKTLDNGLEVRLLPKKGFNKVYALFTTNYGSIDHAFRPLGKTQMIQVPDGIAHFLEHKLFEKEEGDVFQLFGQQGASANAYTSFTETAYLFSTTEQVEKNILTLLDFVQHPYFTEESVNREKGIIAQEIEMYNDHPDWRLMFGLLENLFPDHPVSIDIAGTVDSIQDITADDLYTCYHTYYHPSNMVLTLAGNIDPERLLHLIEDNQAAKSFEKAEQIDRQAIEEDLNRLIPQRTIHMPVQKPKVALGVRGSSRQVDECLSFKEAQSLSLLMSLLFGPLSQNYLDLYDAGLIDDSFSYHAEVERSYDYMAVSCDTKTPKDTLQALRDILLNAKDSKDLTTENFEMYKKRLMGQQLMALNSVEFLARNLYSFKYDGQSVFELLKQINDIQIEDIIRMAENYVDSNRYSEFVILGNDSV